MLQQVGEALSWRVVAGEAVTAASIERLLHRTVALLEVHADIIRRERRLESVLSLTPGLRILAQEPVECLLSFVCAVVSSIQRISWSIEELCRRFGPEISPGLHQFPPLEALAGAHPEELRVGGMEFRCRSLSQAAREIQARGGARYLNSLRNVGYGRAHAELKTIPGVGNKVADCAMLFSLGYHDAFPLDTHTWRAVERVFGLPVRTRTDSAYAETSLLLRERVGPFSGWAQQSLYASSLHGKLLGQ